MCNVRNGFTVRENRGLHPFALSPNLIPVTYPKTRSVGSPAEYNSPWTRHGVAPHARRTGGASPYLWERYNGPAPAGLHWSGETKMSRSRERNLTAQGLWRWIARERKRRGIGRTEFARILGIRRETLYKIEEVRNGASLASTLLDALEQLGALGAVAEIDGMDWDEAVLMSLSKDEAERYDAIAKTNGITRAQVIRQLATEGLMVRREADRAAGRSGAE